MASAPPSAVVVAQITDREVLPPSGRLMSLDVFRGATVAAMILVNNAGDEPSSYWPLRHAQWNGWTPTDLIFPFFLFIVGVAMAISFRARLQRGESHQQLLLHVLWRGILLFALGMFLNGFPNHYQLGSWRVYGVLQRIAICYVISAVLELWLDWRGHLAIVAICLAGYWILMRYVPVPGFGVPTHGFPLLDPDRNLAAWIDRRLLAGHLYERTRDPEGALSTIPAIATTLLGLITGKWLRSRQSITGIFALGSVGVGIGELLNTWFPINKKLWTSSYVLLTAGLAAITLAFLYWLLDLKRLRGRWTMPFLVFGLNSIAAYVLSELAPGILSFPTANRGISLRETIYENVFLSFASPPNASLLYALAYMFACWIVMLALYRKGIYLRI
jgi:predicted acyltransferase